VNALESFFRAERPELLDQLPLIQPQLEKSSPLDQAAMAGWCEFAALVDEMLEIDLPEIVALYEDEAEGYFPQDPDPDRFVVPIFFGAIVNGTIRDLKNGRLQLDQLLASFADLHQLLQRQGHGGSLYGSAVFAQVVSDAISETGDAALAAPAAALVVPWQRLAWLTECHLRNGAAIVRGKGEPLVGDAEEQVTFLLRLAANQPGLSNWPELARFVPHRAENLLPRSEAAFARFREEGLSDDPVLADRLVEEIEVDRHYALDTISVIELEELGVRRLVLTPEERPEGSAVGTSASFHCAFLVDHVAGTFTGTATLGGEETKEGFGRRAVFMIPTILERAAALSEAKGQAGVHESQAAIELLVLSSWRDLVVPEVRDQHYEADQLRKAKGKQGRRAAKRGNLPIVRYIPRRLIYRRAVREAAQREGHKEPKRLYAVSAFSRRLPEGQSRSREAADFAEEIGIPLADHQTVVRPHFRGGTKGEREAAMETGFGHQVRNWRSWSALDLLRTRAAQKGSAGVGATHLEDQ
jgi:hypothetical protein